MIPVTVHKKEEQILIYLQHANSEIVNKATHLESSKTLSNINSCSYKWWRLSFAWFPSVICNHLQRVPKKRNG